MNRPTMLRALLALIQAGSVLAPAFAAQEGGIAPLPRVNAGRMYRQRVWTREHGLPDNRILSLLQTRDGYLWIGTSKGLSRFDGLDFAVIDSETVPDLVSEECTALAEDPRGGLWVGTTEGLVHLAAGDSQRFTTKDGLTDNRIFALCCARNGDLWVGTATGLNRRRAGRFEAILVSMNQSRFNPYDREVRALFEDAAGCVWFANRSCVRRWDPVTDQVKEVRLPGKVQLAMQITGDAHTNVWLRGVSIFHCTPQRTVTTLPDIDLQTRFNRTLGMDEHVQALLADRAGHLWLGWEGSGLTRYRDGEPVEFGLDDGLSDTGITCLLEDREGNLWIGTRSGGLNRWQPRRFTVYSAADGLPHDDTRVVYPARDGGVWIGTERGLALWRDGQILPNPIPAILFDSRIRSLHEDANGALWIGTMDSIEYWANGRLTTHRWSEPVDTDRVRAMIADRAGNLWVGRSAGLTRYRGGQWTHFTRSDGLPHDDVRAILEDRVGRLWLGTYGGGLCAVAPTPTFQVQLILSATNGLSHNCVYALHQDDEGVLWAGTHEGLNRIEFAPNQGSPASPRCSVSRLDERSGLPDDLVNSIVEDDLGHLWIGCDRGISRVARTQLNAVACGRAAQVQCVVYDESDGLPTGESKGQRSQPAACKTPDGRLWFATAKGAVVFDPAQLIQNDLAPPVHIDSVATGDERRIRLAGPPSPHVALPLLASQSGSVAQLLHSHIPAPKLGRAARLDIHFAAPTFRTPDKVRFRCRLEGWDRDWVDAGTERVARYVNLPPGAYRFQVHAASNFGLWNDAPAEVSFTVVVPFLERRWVWAACALVATALAAGVVFWRYRELQRIHDLQRQHALDRERARIARDIHDDLGTGLTRLAMLGERVARESGDPAMQATAGRLAGEASLLIDNLDGLVWSADPKRDRLPDLLAFLRERAALFLADAGIAADLDFPNSAPEVQIGGSVRRAVYLALAEALTNAVRHASASRVAVTARVRDTESSPNRSEELLMLELTVEDDGCGLRAPDVEPRLEEEADAAARNRTVRTKNGSFEASAQAGPSPRQGSRAGGGGHGLPGMRARLEGCGGSLEIHSGIGQGTTLVMRVPLIPKTPEGDH